MQKLKVLGIQLIWKHNTSMRYILNMSHNFLNDCPREVMTTYLNNFQKRAEIILELSYSFKIHELETLFLNLSFHTAYLKIITSLTIR